MPVKISVPMLVVKLFNDRHQPVSHAAFFLKNDINERGIQLEASFDPGLAAYYFSNIPQGEYILTVVHIDYQVDQVPVILAPGKKVEKIFMLVGEGQSFFIQGSRQLPYQPLQEERVIVHFKTALSAKNKEKLEATIKKLGLEEIPDMTDYPDARQFRLSTKRMLHREEKQIRSTLATEEGILQVSNVLEARGKELLLLTDEITVKFKGRINRNEINNFLNQYQLEIHRKPGGLHGHQLRSASLPARELLELCKEIRFDPRVESVDGNVTSTARLMAVNPPDYLHVEQWDHQLINTPGAWETLDNDPQRSAKGNTLFGNPNITIAVLDGGTDTGHPDLTGTLFNGEPKISHIFDFNRMLPDIGAPVSSHGTLCSTAATAHTFTSTPEGMAGVAGESQLMAIRIFRENGSRDADMFEWVGGIDPSNATFPALPAGAAVISNSWGRSILPIIREDVAAAFDRLINYGRDGKGTLVFIAVGNEGVFFESLNPYATHPGIFAIAASTLDSTGKHEIFTPYSNLGGGIQLCAPGASSLTGLHNPPVSYGIFAGTHRNDAIVALGKTSIVAAPAPAPAPPNSIRVAALEGIDVGNEIIIGQLDNPDAERFKITAIDPANTILTLHRPWMRIPVSGDQVLKVRGNCPGGGQTQTTLSANAVAGNVINVNNSTHFFVGKAVMINPNTNVAEAHAIQRVDKATNTVFLMTDLLHPANCTAGARVDVGPAYYVNDFGGTSYSTPVCAGVAALCLAANKNLSWVEVRDIMRKTARKINIGEKGKIIAVPGASFRVGKWRDAEGNDIVSDAGVLNSLPVKLETTLSSIITLSDGTLILGLQDAAGFEAGQAIQISDNVNREIRIATNVSGNKVTLDAPFVNTFPFGATVEAGLKPHFSAAYGYGRVDAAKAVQAALHAELNYRQLVIRRGDRFDDGTAPAVLIHSPDIWITHNALMTSTHVFKQKTSVAGLNDLTFKTEYTGSTNAVFYIEIEFTPPGATDTFRWFLNGEEHTGVAITGQPQLLANGFTIQFNALTGHRQDDNWTVYIDPVETFMDYYDDPPHENPMAANDRFIHARITNWPRGPLTTNDANLDCTLRFSLALSPGKTDNAKAHDPGFDSNFYFSSNGKENDWHDTRPVSEITDGDQDTYFLGEVSIPEGTIPANNNAPNQSGTHIVSIPWKQEAIPPAGIEHSVYLLVHIAPFHSPHNGKGAHNNSCLAYREIAFARFSFKDQAGNELPKQLTIDDFGSAITQSFSLEVLSDIGTFETEKIQLLLSRFGDSNLADLAEFRYNGTNWEFDPIFPTWPGLSIAAPQVLDTSEPAEGLQKKIRFSGEFQTSQEIKRIVITPKILSKHNLITIAAGEHALEIIRPDEVPSGIDQDSLLNPPPPLSHAFADMINLNQTQNEAFGPVAGKLKNVFRVTNLFTANTPTNAYAITDGYVFIQPGENFDKVNLVLKPFKQPIIGFTPIKYFIYRGLRRQDFFDLTDDKKVLPEDDANSEFIKRQRAIFKAQNLLFAEFLSKALGYDPDNQPELSVLDHYFFNTDPGIQLPFAKRGTQLGGFIANGLQVFGLDIVLEEGSFAATLEYVRKGSHEIDVSNMSTGTDAEKLRKKLQQEEILSFLDIAGFYGMHVAQKGTVTVREGGTNTVDKKGRDIYATVMDKIVTKNKVYLDIRNENGDSYNFYGNYKGVANDPDIVKNIQLGITADQLTPRTYETEGWPIIMENRAAQNHTSDTNSLYCKLRFSDNKKPMLYVEEGTLINRLLPAPAPHFVDATELGDHIENAVWTARIGFDIPNTTNQTDISTVIKLYYSRSHTITTWPNTVLKTETATDNVFGPIHVNLLWDANTRIKWISAQDKKYIDLSQRGYMAERGVAVDNFSDTDPNAGRVIFYGVACDHFDVAGFNHVKGITGGVSTKGTFFEAAGFLQGLKLSFDQLLIAGTKITTLQLIPASAQAMTPDAILLLCISRQELEALKSVSGFHSAYARYVKLELEDIGHDDNNKPFSKYRLKVQGLDGNGMYRVAAPNKDIFVYSVDRFLYFSDAYSKDEPLPTIYNRTAEENIGALMNPQTKQSWEDFFIKKDTQGPLDGILQKAEHLVQGFINEIDAIPNDEQAKLSLETAITNIPSMLLQRMRVFAASGDNNNADDRILYWSRIRMKVALQSHEFMLQSFSERNGLLERFEKTSRGYDDINFSAAPRGIKKVLLAGFDPYFLSPGEGAAHNILNSNPSGAAALALHGKLIRHFIEPRDVAFVQSVIFPVRYADLDSNGGEGIVETFFNRFVDPADPNYTPVDMIVIIDKYQPDAVTFGRYAARKRGAQKDNNFQRSTEMPPVIGPVGSPVNTPTEFVETNLPLKSSMTGLKYIHYFNQAYAYQINDGGAIKKFTNEKRESFEKLINNPNEDDPTNLQPLNQSLGDITAIRGAFEPYFANEVAYRLGILCAKKNPTARTGLLMLPRIQGTAAEMAQHKKMKRDFDGVLTKEVIDELRDIISTMAAGDA